MSWHHVQGFSLGVIVMALVAIGSGEAHWKPETRHNRVHAITHAFCQSLKPCWRGNEAIRVARCESGENLWPYARSSGGHWGMFQFGAWARATFGFSWSPWTQAKAAFLYYRMSGWSGWSCKP